MEQDKLKEILRAHSLYLTGNTSGRSANLQYASLRGANLQDANLQYANLQDANLQYANLQDANLQDANLQYANLQYANLRGASLRGANLQGANLWGANLWGANLQDANLQYANLQDANLQDANLQYANLQYANLRGASLRGANLQGANLPHSSVVPTKGSFIAYKKTTLGVIEIEIPARALRTSTLVGRKCRASAIIVLGGEGVGGESPTQNTNKITYSLGEIKSDRYNDDIRIECAEGIHFFMTEEEAQAW